MMQYRGNSKLLTYLNRAVKGGDGKDVGTGHCLGTRGFHCRLDGVYHFKPSQGIDVGQGILLRVEGGRIVQQK